MPERIALFGGSFNPIHHGHLIIARSVVEQLGLDQVIFVPCRRPPHKSAVTLADAEHRAAMVRLAISDEPRFGFSDFELRSDGPNYTIDTVAHFRAELGLEVSLHVIIGVDSLNELPGWYRAAALVDACRIVTALRPGWDEIRWEQLRTRLSEEHIAVLQAGVLTTPRVEISSTDIRRRMREGKSVRYLLPEAVRLHAEQHGLYRGGGA